MCCPFLCIQVCQFLEIVHTTSSAKTLRCFISTLRACEILRTCSSTLTRELVRYSGLLFQRWPESLQDFVVVYVNVESLHNIADCYFNVDVVPTPLPLFQSWWKDAQQQPTKMNVCFTDRCHSPRACPWTFVLIIVVIVVIVIYIYIYIS